MTVDIATLAIRIDSLEARNAARDMERMREAGGRAEQQVTALDSVTRKLAQALALLGVGAGVGAIIRMADEYTKFNAQLRLATQSQREYAAAVDDVRRIANSAQQDLAATGVLYARIANGTRELGVQQKQVAAITEVVNLSLKVSGATAAESASAMLQLSQSFASGTLRGEEFNAVNEAAPRLMKALADGIGVPVGALKKMAEEGAITSKIMADVLPQALQQLQEEAKQVQTISGAFTVLKNKIMEFTGVQAQASGAVSLLTTGIGVLADNLTLLAGVSLTLVAVNIANWLTNLTIKTYERVTAAYAQVAAENAVRAATIAAAEADLARATAAGATAAATQAAILIAREETVARLAQARSNILSANAAIEAATAAGAQSFALRTLRLATAELAVAEAARVAMIAELALLGQQQARVSAQITAALAAQTAAQAALNAANGAGVASIGLLGRAVGFLGGPIGAIITLLGLAATAWMVWGDKGAEAEKKVTATLAEEIDEYIANLNRQIDKLKERNELAGKKMVSGVEPVTDGEKKRESILAEINRISKDTDLNIETKTQVLAVWGGKLNAVTQDLERFNAEQKKNNDITRDARLAKWYAENGTAAQRLAAELAKLKAQFGEIPPEMEKLVRAKFADKDAASALKQEQTAYQALMTSIEEKVAANKLEMSGYNQLTESQKLTIKLDAEIATGKTKLNAGDIERARALIAVVAMTDAVIASNKRAAAGAAEFTAMQKAHDDQVAKSIQSAQDEAAKNEELVVTFGMTKGAIEQLELARLQDQLAQRASTGLTADEIATLEQLIDAKRRNAAAVTRGEDLAAAQKGAEELAQFLDPAKAQSFGDALRDAFSGAGNALVKLSTSLQAYTRSQAEFEKQRGNAADSYLNGKSTEIEYTKDLIALDKMQTSEKLGSYGDMAGAAASFFNEQSNGYKVLQGVSQAFHVAQLAMNLASIGPAIAAGAAQMFAQSGWGGFAGVAAMIGVMAALGAATGGGGGPSAKYRQENQGTGSVLGDSSAKSDSIARSIELSAANSSIELTHTAGMLASLKAIENSISGLGNLLVRGSGLTGEVKGGSKSAAENLVNNTTFQLAFGGVLGVALNKLDQALGGWGGKLASSVFGGKVTALDTGLTADSASLAAIMAGGLNAQQYTDTKKSGGLFRSDKYSTTTTDLGDEANDQFTKVILGLSNSITTAAGLLGVDGDAFTQKLNSFVVDIGKISLKDLKGEDIQAALEAVFSKLGDDMAQFGVAGLEQFQQVGEGYFETLTRVATNYANLNSILESIGMTFGATGMSSIAARERLIALAGGIDELATQTSSFAENFLTQAERLAPVQKYVNEELAAMGLQGITTREQFKDVVLGLDVTTESGAKQYTALLALADAFAKTHAATVDLTKSEQAIADERADLQSQLDELTMTQAQLAAKARAAIDAHNLALYDQVIAAQAAKDATQALLDDVGKAYTDLQSAIGAEKAALKTSYDKMIAGIQAGIADVTASVTKLKSLSQSLHSTLDSIRVATGDEATDRAAAQAQIAAALAIAKAGGPLPEAESLKNALAALSKDPSDQFATYLDYQRDAYQTMGNLAALADLTDDQLSTEERALEVLQKQKDLAQLAYDAEVLRLDGILDHAKSQVDLLNGIASSLMSLPDALAAIAKAIGTAQQNPTIGTDALTGLYKDLLGRAPDAAGLKFWQDALASGNSLDHVKNQFLTSPEYLGLHPFDVGTNYVPRDMPAYIHEGEAIIPAADNRELMSRLSSPAGNNDALVEEIRELRRENAEWRAMQESHLYAIAKSARNTEDFLDGAINGDTPIATKEVTEETA